ncbi:MAG TPA: thioesterase family protein [Candidatus Sulfotelmatobacter sp.]|nr:thioesterase family protein [Candidatus Sulfotelmatobacter sp.]
MHDGGPIVSYRARVPRDWVDYNGHLNVGYYMIAFDKATDGFADQLGIGEAYLKATGNSFYVVEAHLCFEREVMQDAPIRIETLLLDADDKRVHFCHCMVEETGDFLAATSEMLILHVNLATRRAAPFPPEPARTIAALAERQRGVARPPQLGRAVALRRRS